MRPGVCERVRATEVQSKLDAKERRKNPQDAFALKQSGDGKHVAILDDMATTGTTVEILAEVLRDAGAARISVWSAARASLRE